MTLSGVPYQDDEQGNQMGERVRALDWSKTPLGPIEKWPPYLRLSLSICLDAGFPIALYWGAEFTLLYNDAWIPIPGDKHPWALGRPAHEVWPEIWDNIGPNFARVMATGEAIFAKDERFFMERHGYIEECYFDYTLGPVRGEGCAVGGIFNAALETTSRVLGERRMRLLRELTLHTAAAKSAEEACVLAAETLAAASEDVPFALLYLVHSDGRQAGLSSTTGMARDTPASPLLMDLTETDAGCWPLATVARTGKPELVSDLTSRFGRLPGGSWPEPAVQALVLPIAATGRGGLAGFFVVGVSPRRALDDDYRAFFELTAGQVATAVANARAAGREEALHLLAAIVESSEDAIIGMNLNGTITSWNNGAERLFGSKTEEMVGHSISEIIPPERSDELHKILRQIGRGQHVEHFETIRRRKDNSLVPVSLTVSAVRDASGKIMGASKIARDVTERKRAEEALRQSEADLKLALDGGSLGEWKWEIATDKVSWSPLCKALYGLPPDADMNYERFLAAVHPDDRERVAAALQRAVETRTDYEQEKRIVWPDGSVHWNAARGRVYCDAGGQPLRMAGVTMDVTERTRAEEALRRSEAYLAEAQRLSHTGSWAWNVARREFVHWSLEHYHIHGLDPDRGIPSWEAAQQFIHPEDRARCLEGIERAIRERANCDLDYRAVLPDGALKFIHSIGHPVFNAAGELVEFVGTEMDVTERKRAEEALRQSHALLNAVAEGTSDAVFVKDLQGRYLMINTAGARFLGKTVNEVVGKDDRELFSPETARAIMERDRSVLAAGESQTEEEIGTAAGVTRTYLTMKGVYRDPQGQVIGLIGIARDITERKRADESLRRSEEMLLRAQVIGHIGSWVFDVRDGVFSGSEEGYRMCGWGPGSHRGEELLAIVHPDDLPRMQTAWLATMAGARTKLSIGWWSMASLNG